MRLRNIPRADDFIANHNKAVNEIEMKENRGKWNQVFGNEAPIYIEIGMGKGQFILTLAKENPHINYVGIERYSSVLLRALEKYDTEEFGTLENIRFICMDARELDQVFAPEEVGKIYLNFSDPWPKARHASRRLPSRAFLARYDQVLQRDGVVEFKTDNRGLFDSYINITVILSNLQTKDVKKKQSQNSNKISVLHVTESPKIHVINE